MREADDSGPGVLTVSCGFAPFVIGPALTSRVTRDARTDTITIASLLRRSGKIMSFVVAARVWHGGMLHTTRRLRICVSRYPRARRAAHSRGTDSPLRTPQAHQAHPHEHRTSKTVNLKCASPAPQTPPRDAFHSISYSYYRCHIQTVSAHRSSPWAGLTACSILRESIIGEIWGRYRRDIGEMYGRYRGDM